MKVVRAEKVATFDRVLKVRGSEKIRDTMAVTKEKTIEHVGWPVTVFKYSAPTRQCKP